MIWSFTTPKIPPYGWDEVDDVKFIWLTNESIVSLKKNNMGYIEKSLADGEEVIEKFSLHWTTWFFPVLLSLFVVGIPLLLSLMFTEIGLTNKKVIVKKGILSRQTDEMKLSKVENVELKQSVLGRILGYGQIVVSGTGSGRTTLNKVASPLEVKKQIEAQLD